MADDTVLVGMDGAVATVTLNRPKAHNAFDDALVAELTRTFEWLGAHNGVRVVVLAGRGKSFSAGADLAYMKRAAGFSEAQNVVDARAVAGLLMMLGGLPKPTVALVQGPAYGGGVGLVSACDIAIAAEGVSFALTEVRLGLIPAVISPFVVRAIGDSYSRRFMLTGERFDAQDRAPDRVGARGGACQGARRSRRGDRSDSAAMLARRAAPGEGADRRGLGPADRRCPGRRCRAPDRRCARIGGREGGHRRLSGEAVAQMVGLSRQVR